jgi:hypothetical protein
MDLELSPAPQMNWDPFRIRNPRQNARLSRLGEKESQIITFWLCPIVRLPERRLVTYSSSLLCGPGHAFKYQ